MEKMFKILYDILPCRSLDMTSLWLFPSSTACLQLVGGRGPAICVAWSVSCVRVLRVNKWEVLEFVLVQVGYKLLIWGCQHWGVACEKTIKVLSIAPTLPWRGEQSRERGRWGERRGEDGMSLMKVVEKKRTTNKQQREKREIQLKTWHQPIKSLTAETVDFHWSVCEPVTFQRHHWSLH